ncbi:DeoR/GlpR family DNA-binding transcription regulator [Dyadobacter sp. CY312]|uniref:DeoR/GlpR family DNA-binding transcription regulator n=1 Tax=Dyadobacter sp. CY312 TaxID=2907303 RepID=UPI001F219580|nr:DeoR/GlpR family DNA-binding transcription regulator [Dyadobacter sp. CY312]MCE7042212.1 DeoR/GlpR family DNA-binding transcription regulator [Dyadobacter sp. CY312]
MNFQKRKNIILATLKQDGEVNVKELAEEIGISEITIRRDLVVLANDGLLYRTHGGAMRLDLVNTPIDFKNKTASNVEQKDHICRIAAQEIVDGDIIFMDCGSTVFRLCQFIRHKKIRVVTNSLPVLYELMDSSVAVNLVGGEVDKERQAVHGRIAEEHIARYKVTKAFIGIDGISAENGLSAHSEQEAGITLAAASHADVTYLLCDSSKVGKDKYLQFAPLSLVNVMITNQQTDAVRALEKTGLKVLTELKTIK